VVGRPAAGPGGGFYLVRGGSAGATLPRKVPARALARYVPTAEELRPGRQYIVDGTLLHCWSWASEPGLYSGKHKTTGMNVQVVCTLEGELVDLRSGRWRSP
jgi:hypothetical protein